MDITITLPAWMVDRITDPRDETDTKMAAAWLLGAAMVEIENLTAECEHGLSLSLCAGPNHYPEDY